MKNTLKKPLEDIGQFYDDDEAKRWINAKNEEGYVITHLNTDVVHGRRDRRIEEVCMTITMRLDLSQLSPASASATVTTLRDLVLPPVAQAA